MSYRLMTQATLRTIYTEPLIRPLAGVRKPITTTSEHRILGAFTLIWCLLYFPLFPLQIQLICNIPPIS